MKKVPTIPVRIVSVAAAKKDKENVVLLVVKDNEGGQTRILSVDTDNAVGLYVRLGRILQGFKREQS